MNVDIDIDGLLFKSRRLFVAVESVKPKKFVETSKKSKLFGSKLCIH